MRSSSFLLDILKLIFVDIIWKIIYFPIWWYSKGFFDLLINFIEKVKRQSYALGIFIGFKFLFRPMYAQNDFSGRIISFFMRLIVLIFKIFIFILFLVVLFFGVAIYLALPVFVIWQIYLNFVYLKTI
ncbi:MAG: hypothetical protein PHW42_00770 [Patescibacteria group bacterium]|nr:hypothetical protein [Patescibacteria group bacterium]MDD4694971.1 hypothetical protein [Patescibacteria group bacterium]